MQCQGHTVNVYICILCKLTGFYISDIANIEMYSEHECRNKICKRLDNVTVIFFWFFGVIDASTIKC
jgi:hypothetical protein